MKVKVCGITRPEDGALAAVLGAWAVGFVFAPSPRRLSPEEAAELSARIPAGPLRVGVFVDEEPERILEVAERVGLDLFQLHGSEPPEACDLLGPHRVLKAIRVRSQESLAQAASYVGHCFALLLDAWAPERAGGTGRSWDWSLARRAGGWRIVLAGGLNPDNVGEAVATVAPWAVDVSSGVESAPGVKDPVLLERFFRAVEGAS